MYAAVLSNSWWRHQMKTFSALPAICAGNSPVSGEFPTQRLVTRSFDIFIDLRLNKRLSKQWWGWWFETLPCPSWRHCNVFWWSLMSGNCILYYLPRLVNNKKRDIKKKNSMHPTYHILYQKKCDQQLCYQLFDCQLLYIFKTLLSLKHNIWALNRIVKPRAHKNLIHHSRHYVLKFR